MWYNKKIMSHPYLEQVYDRYAFQRSKGSDLMMGATTLRAISRDHHLQASDDVIEGLAGKTTGDRLRVRHDMAGLAMRLGILSHVASPALEDGFDTSLTLTQGDRDDILTGLYQQDSLPPIVDAAQVRQMIFAARTQLQTPAQRLAALRAYLQPWRQVDQPPLTSFGVADAIFVQAFGRDTYTDAELPQVSALRQHHDTDKDALDELIETGFDPGPSNNKLAEYAKEYVEGQELEAMAQWEVAAAMRQSDPEWYDRYDAAIHVLWPKTAFYPTYDVKRDSIDILSQRGLYLPIELAHPAMIARVTAIIRRQGVIADMPTGRITIPYDLHSTQARVRERDKFLWWEIATRAHHLVSNEVRL